MRQATDLSPTLEHVYLRHHLGLYRFCLRLTHDAVAADDLAQESFVRLFAKLSELPDSTDFEAYLQATARNTYLKRLRDTHDQPDRRIDELAGFDDDITWDPERAVLLAEQRGQVRRALARLTTRHRRVLAMREVEGHSYAHIGRTLGVDSDAVAQVIARARATLRRELRLEQVDADQLPEICQRMLKPLSAYLDGHLSAAERRDLEAHLAQCAGCQATLQAFRAAPRRFRGLGPAGSLASALGRLAGATRSLARLPTLGASSAALTAAGVIAVGGAGLWVSRSAEAPAQPHHAHAPLAQGAALSVVAPRTRIAGAVTKRPVGTAARRHALRTTHQRRPRGTRPVGPQPRPGGGSATTTPAAGAWPGTTLPAATTPPGVAGGGPSVTTPSVSVPPVTTHVTVPPTTVGPVTTPRVTIPVPTTPSVTVPRVTVPVPTTPSVTVPRITVPVPTTPSVTVPPVTVPVTTPTVTLPRSSLTVPVPDPF